jgi:protein-disulfide isomerase
MYNCGFGHGSLYPHPVITFESAILELSKMALPPKFAAHRLVLTDQQPVASSPAPPPPPPPPPPAQHTIEVYLDYTCPYAARTFQTLDSSVFPAVRADQTLAPAVQFIFRHQIQPWHPASLLAHEAALAVLRTVPKCFWPFSKALFAAQQEFFDAKAATETRNQTYARLARIANSVGADGDVVLSLLVVPEVPAADLSYNAGNAMTKDIKQIVKMARLMHVHVTPTVVLDGITQDQISSSWTGDQWLEWMKSFVQVPEGALEILQKAKKSGDVSTG